MKYLKAASTGATLAALSLCSMAGTAIAQESSGGLEEITVTAQFRAQNVQDTPLAITAISGETLELRSQTNIQEIAAQAPNVQLTQGGAFGGNSLTAYIRGVGQVDFIPSVEPGVAMYVDDVYYASITGAVMELLDLERVEIARGPQGTLAGKNAVGGSIKLFSKKPSGEQDGYVDVGFGEFSAVRVRGATNFTLIEDKLWARISGVSSSRDGYVKNLDFGCENPGSIFETNRQINNCVTGTEGGIDYTAARLAIRYMPSDNFELNFSANVVDEDSDPIPNIAYDVGATPAPVIDPNFGLALWQNAAGVPTVNPLTGTIYTGPEAGPGCLYIAGPNSCNPNAPRSIYYNYSTYDNYISGVAITREKTLESQDFTLNMLWTMDNGMTFNSITSTRQVTSGWGQDEDGTPVPLGYLYQYIDQSQFSQEFRLNGGSADTFDWVVGAFYHTSEAPVTGRIGLGYVGFDFLHGPDPVDTTTSALFANGTFYLGDAWELNAGIRFSSDEKDYRFNRRNPDLSAIQPCLGPPGTPGNPPNCLISAVAGETAFFEDDRVDYRLALTYKVNDSSLVYGSVATGYKGGGNNPRPFFNSQIVSIDPEELTTLEAGFKTTFWDGRARLNAAYFFNDYTGIQSNFSFCPQFADADPCLATLNSGDADVSGFEFEFDAAITDAITVDASFATLDFEWTNTAPGADIDPNGITPFSPEMTWSIGVQYNAGNFFARLDSVYQDDIFTEANNNPGALIPDYTLLNGSIALNSPDGEWRVKLEVKNITDEEYLYYIQDGSSEGIDYAAPALPRTWMVSLRREFF